MMAEQFTGFCADEINAKRVELKKWQAKSTELESAIAQAVSNRDLDTLAALRGKRDSVPLIVKAVETELAGLHKRREAAFAEQAREQYDAAIANRPARETITDPATGNTHTIVRAKL